MRTIPTGALGLLAVIVFGLDPPRQAAAGSYTLTTLASFNAADIGVGGSQGRSLVRDEQGNFYGTTYGGGANGLGTVYELAAGSDTITTLASFNGANGSAPVGLVRDAQGNLYGTASYGGPNFVPGQTFSGFGTVFELTAGSSTITTLASFNGANGVNTLTGLVRDAQGNLYGTTYGGGSIGVGTIFELAAGSNTITTLASFNFANGHNPSVDLVRDAQGNLYGATLAGSNGSVFELAAGSNTITTLASFNGANGTGPRNLILDAQGNFYGTTSSGGAFGLGTVFELAAGSNTITTLASLNLANGTNSSSLVRDAQGNLYGTTNQDLPNGTGFGKVFELAAGSNTVTTLVSFDGANGANPQSLTLDAQGNLYGTTMRGGTNNQGTIFMLSPTAVPAPSSLVLMGPGMVVLAGLALRARARRAGVVRID